MMTVSDIWKLDNGSVVKIGSREYEYNNVDGRRLITDIVVRDVHDICEWFTGEEEIEWIRE